jgi:hypothetical protein
MRDADPTRFVELNREFHSRIYPAARRPRLHEITDALSKSAASYVRMNGRRLRLRHGAAAGSGGATTLPACSCAGGRTVCKTSCNTAAGSSTVPVERQAT